MHSMIFAKLFEKKESKHLLSGLF